MSIVSGNVISSLLFLFTQLSLICKGISSFELRLAVADPSQAFGGRPIIGVL